MSIIVKWAAEPAQFCSGTCGAPPLWLTIEKEVLQVIPLRSLQRAVLVQSCTSSCFWHMTIDWFMLCVFIVNVNKWGVCEKINTFFWNKNECVSNVLVWLHPLHSTFWPLVRRKSSLEPSSNFCVPAEDVALRFIPVRCRFPLILSAQTWPRQKLTEHPLAINQARTKS